MCIPISFEYESVGRKQGINELWDKNSIERWMSTSDNIKKVLPQIFNILENDIIHSEWWNDFIKLGLYEMNLFITKQIRIIHLIQIFYRNL